MAKIAVDVVLSPSDTMTDIVIEANRKLLQKVGGKIALNKENCLPHISLAMGALKKADVPVVSEILGKIAQQFSIMTLHATRVSCGTTPAGKKVSGLEIENTKDLQLLHETIMRGFAPYITYDASPEMIHGYPDVDEESLHWINNYQEKASYKNFSPHITLGFGEVEATKLTIRFTASQLVICHLGNYCTCRKILALANLEP